MGRTLRIGLWRYEQRAGDGKRSSHRSLSLARRRRLVSMELQDVVTRSCRRSGSSDKFYGPRPSLNRRLPDQRANAGWATDPRSPNLRAALTGLRLLLHARMRPRADA